MMKRSPIVLAVVFLFGCASPPPQVFRVTPETLGRRQLETRRYDGIKEVDLLSASENVLQDLGFNLENSETKLGVLTAVKQRTAVETGEVVLALVLGMLTGTPPPWSKDQTIRVSLVVSPVNDSNGNPIPDSHYVRVTFQRSVRRTDNTVYVQTLRDPKLFEAFHAKLSKSVFIEGQKI
jgi:hypothetical protein